GPAARLWHGACIGSWQRLLDGQKLLSEGEREMALEPGGIIAWLVVGLIAGWLAGLVMKGGGYGILGAIVMGLIRALVGGFLFGLRTPGASAGLPGSSAVAFTGAVVFIALVRALRGRGPV